MEGGGGSREKQMEREKKEGEIVRENEIKEKRNKGSKGEKQARRQSEDWPWAAGEASRSLGPNGCAEFGDTRGRTGAVLG